MPVGQCRLPHAPAPADLDELARSVIARCGRHRRGAAVGCLTATPEDARRAGARRANGWSADGPHPVRVVFLGGLGEIGRNCACIEVDGRILVLDVGIMFPDPDMPGVDLVLPDFTYLRENVDRVDGIILTHGHEDHTGGLAYLLRDFSVPIYGSELTLALARNRVDEAGMADRAQFVPVARRRAPADRALRRRVHPGDPLGAPRVRHRVPHPAGRRSSTRVTSRSTSTRSTIAGPTWPGWARSRPTRGSASCSPTRPTPRSPGFTPSESTVGATLEKVFLARPDRRFIVTCFASHIHRIQQVADAAIAGGRVVATLGRSMEKNVALARRLGAAAHPRCLDRRHRGHRRPRAREGLRDLDRIAGRADVRAVAAGRRREPLASASPRATSS